ncbi:unnamed protein product [Coccothraustes coccothraustes]
MPEGEKVVLNLGPIPEEDNGVESWSNARSTGLSLPPPGVRPLDRRIELFAPILSLATATMILALAFAFSSSLLKYTFSASLKAVRGAFTKPTPPTTPPIGTSLRGKSLSTLGVLDWVLQYGLSSDTKLLI